MRNLFSPGGDGSVSLENQISVFDFSTPLIGPEYLTTFVASSENARFDYFLTQLFITTLATTKNSFGVYGLMFYVECLLERAKKGFDQKRLFCQYVTSLVGFYPLYFTRQQWSGLVNHLTTLILTLDSAVPTLSEYHEMFLAELERTYSPEKFTIIVKSYTKNLFRLRFEMANRQESVQADELDDLD